MARGIDVSVFNTFKWKQFSSGLLFVCLRPSIEKARTRHKFSARLTLDERHWFIRSMYWFLPIPSSLRPASSHDVTISRMAKNNATFGNQHKYRTNVTRAVRESENSQSAAVKLGKES